MDAHAHPILQDAVARTLAYFDLFDHPLTLLEVQRYLRFPSGEGRTSPTMSDILSALGSPAFGEESGFYFLAGRQGTVATRQRRFRLAERKFRRALLFARLARLLPSVRFVAVCNSLSYANAEEGSDIDLFVVVRRGTIWATRFLIAGALALFDLRPREGKEADMYCASFFVTEDALDISRFAVPGDVYLQYWAATLAPLYDAGGVQRAFLEANKDLFADLPGVLRERVPTGRACPPAPRWSAPFLPLLRALEPHARRFQEKRFPGSIRELANKDGRVVISDDVLKFHVNDRRERYAQAYRERVAALRLPVRA